MTATSEKLPGNFFVSAETKCNVSHRAPVTTDNIEHHALLDHHDFTIFTNRDIPASDRSLSFGLDDNIQSGDYPIGAPGQPIFGFKYLEHPSGNNGAGTPRQYVAIAGGAAQVVVHKHEQTTRYTVNFKFTGKHSDGEELHIEGCSDIYLQVYPT